MSDALQEAQALYREAIDATRDQRNQMEQDLEFSNPSAPQQWDPELRRQREADPGGARPCLTHDQLSQYIANVAGQFEQRPPALHAIPVDSGGDKRVADSLDGILRHIEHSSRAQQHYARAQLSAARCGVGYLTLRPDYVDRALNYQEPRIGSEGDPLRVVFDPWSVELDGSDATFGYILTPNSHREWERKYGKAEKVSFGSTEQSRVKDERESVMTAECWRVDTKKKNMFVIGLPDGGEDTISEDDYWLRYQAEAEKPIVLRQYEDKVKTVYWSVMSGAEVLVKEREYPASGIGIIPMYGYVGWSNGRMQYCGMARRAREPQQAYNYHISEIRAYMNDAPKSPWLVPVRALDGDLKKLWDRASLERRAYLPYIDSDDDGPIAPPQRSPVSTNLQNLVQGAQQALSDIQAALGMYQANLGAPSNETSGIAIESRKQQGEASTSHFTTHASASIGQVGRLCVDMIPRLIDTKRRMRILGIDMTPSSVVIDPSQPQAMRETEGGIVINPGAGRYDVRVVVGAAFSTQRQQAQAAYTEMMRANPNLMPVIAPLWAQTMDVPHADKLAQVLTAVAPPEVQAILKPQDAQPTSGELQAQIEQMKQALQEALSVAQESQQECDQLKAEVENANAELEAEKNRTEIQMFDAETKRMSVMKDVQGDQQAGIEAAKQAAMEVVQQMLAGFVPPEQPEPMEREEPEAPEPRSEQPIVVNVSVDARQPVNTSKQVILQRDEMGNVIGGSVFPSEEM